jgi:hypothetical protein
LGVLPADEGGFNIADIVEDYLVKSNTKNVTNDTTNVSAKRAGLMTTPCCNGGCGD